MSMSYRRYRLCTARLIDSSRYYVPDTSLVAVLRFSVQAVDVGTWEAGLCQGNALR